MSLKTCLQVPALTRIPAFREPTLPHSPAPTLPPSEGTYTGVLVIPEAWAMERALSHGTVPGSSLPS